MFYPDSPSSLKAMINDFMAKAEEQAIDGKLVALIVPHAGYMYSGQVAAYAYKQIKQHFDIVVLIGVSHRAPVRGASVLRSGAYETPLGAVSIDSDLVEELVSQSNIFGSSPSADAIEHSLEVQVPFLQVVLSDFRIVPILIGHWSESLCSDIAEALAKSIKDKNVLIVASTDMSHYHSYKEAVSMDDIALTSIKRMDELQLMDDLSSGEAELCGAGPVIAALMFAKKLGADGIKLLKYANSGDVTGDKSSGVVGYFAAAIYQT